MEKRMESGDLNNLENNDVEDGFESDFVLSICWDAMILSAAYFDLTLLELHVINETTDLKPDYSQMRNLFRQVQPSCLVASGPNAFIDELVEMLELQHEDINKYKDTKKKTGESNESNLAIYSFNRKSQSEEYRKTIYEIDIPGLPADSSAQNRKIFIDSVLPMDQELSVLALGNLVRYIRDNFVKWKNVFMNMDKNLIITSVYVKSIDQNVIIDETTFDSLNIFSTVYHPSNFKKQVRRDGLSIYNLLNQCASSMGSQELKSMLKQPIRDLNEINMRLSTIEFCLDQKNFDAVVKYHKVLKDVLNINAVYNRILINKCKSSDWKSLKKGIKNCFVISQITATMNAESIKGTIFQELAEYGKDEHYEKTKQIVYYLDKIVDIDQIEEKKRFIVKENWDEKLDESRVRMNELLESYLKTTPDEVLTKISNIDDFTFAHFPEVGFVVATQVEIFDDVLEEVKGDDIVSVFKTTEASYLRTPLCKEFNDEYDSQMMQIIEQEQRILERFLFYINENLLNMLHVNRLCAKLDVLVSLSSVASIYKFVKPMISEKKEIAIINGRHPLVEQTKAYVSSTTIINDENKNFVNIIHAPNSSGKSVYMKQVALIFYLAHIGSFVPAEKCKLMLIDAIYTKIHNSESIYQGESAFLSDLQQLSKVVMNSSSSSLVLIDEFGKGTLSKDGTALIVAAIEHFCQRAELSPITFISTHYSQVFQILTSNAFLNIKTIVTKKNEQDVFESNYTIVDGQMNKQDLFTEYPEGKKIISNIFNQNKELDEELTLFGEAYQNAIKSFVIILAKMKLRRDYVSEELIEDLYSKVDVENFLS